MTSFYHLRSKDDLDIKFNNENKLDNILNKRVI